MGLGEQLAVELEHEAASTRRLFERLRDEDLGWQPHPKSWTTGKLAGHITEMIGWVDVTMRETEFSVQGQYTPFVPATVAELLAKLDENLPKGLATLKDSPDKVFGVVWSMISRGKTIFSMPRGQVIRAMVLNHIIHHRGQLTVYARLRDVPLPAIYGNSADDAGVFAD